MYAYIIKLITKFILRVNSYMERKITQYFINLIMRLLILFFSFKIFLYGPFLKSLLNLLHCFCFTFCFFSWDACGILGPWPGIEPTPPALEGKVLTTGLPGKSQHFSVILDLIYLLNRYSLNVYYRPDIGLDIGLQR